MNLRRRIASSSLARIAAVPSRAAMGLRHVGKESTLAAKWLIGSREHTNFTYDLEPRNVEHLAWWASVVSGASHVQCREWILEAMGDEVLIRHVQDAVVNSPRRGLADVQVRIGRRAGWYALVRALKPEFVVETGTDKGLGAVVIASALMRNGRGQLTSIDINPDAGHLIGGGYRDVIDLVISDSIEAINRLPGGIGVFIHDSDHSALHEAGELAAVEEKLTDNARVLSDNSHATDSLMRWAEKGHRRFLYFQEVPSNHWYEGGGIGAAWIPTQD